MSTSLEQPYFESELEATQSIDNRETLEIVTTANGKFYNSLLDSCLTEQTPEMRTEQLNQLVAELPERMRKIYGRGVEKFQEELGFNHDLIEQHRGDEVKFLLREVMQSEKKSQEEIATILQGIGKPGYIEPTPGLAIIQTEKDAFRFLKEKGLLMAAGHAVMFASDTRDNPSFMVIQRLSLEKGVNDTRNSLSEHVTIRHELHHIVWNFLERSGFVRPVKEENPDKAKALKHFRDELCAYTIEKRDFGTIEPELLAYISDKALLKEVTRSRDLAATCVEIATKKNKDPQQFLYAAMTADTFDNLEKKFLAMTPLADYPDSNDTAILFNIWSGYNRAPVLKDILERKGIKVEEEALKDFGQQFMQADNIRTLSDINRAVGRYEEFADFVGVALSNKEEFAKQALHRRLPLSPETIAAIKTLPPEQHRTIPLDKNGADFLRSFVSFWSAEQPVNQKLYATLINSSPDLRQAFDAIKEEIIQRGSNMYRQEMKGSGPDKVNKAIQIRSEALRSL